MHRNFGLTPKMPTDCLPTICPRVYRTGRTQMPFGHKEKTLLLNQLQCFEYSAEYFCDPPGARTQDPNIKSVVLYQLS